MHHLSGGGAPFRRRLCTMRRGQGALSSRRTHQTYYKWQKRLFTMAKAQHEVQFAEVTPITETPLSQQAAISIHIAGATVDIHSGADTATVEMILRILKSC